MPQAALIAGLVFFSAAGLVYVLFDTFVAEERQVRRVLDTLSAYDPTLAEGVDPTLSTPFHLRVLRPTAGFLVNLVRGFGAEGMREKMKASLQAAGRPLGLDPDGLIAVKTLAGVSVPFILVLLSFAGYLSLMNALLWGVIGALVGYQTPDVMLWAAIRRRRREIRAGLPDLLDLLMISVEAGLGFDQALARVIRGASGPLAEEFGRMLQEVHAGVPRKEAMRNLAKRTDVSELGVFAMAMIQADVFGVSVSKVLRTQASEMRLRRKQRAEEQAQKAPVLMVFPVVLCIMPATILVVAGPAILSIGEAFGLM